MAYAGAPVVGVISTKDVTDDTITYYNGDALPENIMYQDTDGYGGVGNGDYASVDLGLDDGGCFNFGSMGVGGCHGPAGSDPDGNSGNSEYPLFETPKWLASANLSCGRCHGNPNRAETATGYIGGTYKKDIYGYDFDGTLANGGVVPQQIIGSPGADNRGGWDSTILGDPDKTKYIGQHEKHLNYSFRFSKGDSCNLCHAGHYDDVDNLDGKHGNNVIEVELDLNASGPLAHYNSGTVGVAGTCYDMDPYGCHPSSAEPKWDTTATFACIGCHTMQGDINKIGHFTDPSGLIDDDEDDTNLLDDGPMLGNCTWCHFAGHPTGYVNGDETTGEALILPNNSQVGITYKSGGIHLRKQPGKTGPIYQTQAELCWGCHDQNNDGDLNDPGDINEFGTDYDSNNTSTEPPNPNSDYDYGELTTADWTTATWSSGAGFTYKTGPITSTHSTNLIDGTSSLGGVEGAWTEATDDVEDILCHNCHDVHNMNFAKGDNPLGLAALDGQPYLRGTWVRNPYLEDGAPQDVGVGSSFAAENKYMAVPRGGTMYQELGGFQIDQNNVDPTYGAATGGLGLGNSAGLCTLCHGSVVDDLDNVQNGSEGLWIGVNGHSNSAIGGTADDGKIADILSYAIRNPGGDPAEGASFTQYTDGTVSSMGYANVGTEGSTSMRVSGFRAVYTKKGYGVTPGIISTNFAYIDFDWGTIQDTGTIDKGYHAFTCSKCHNPHASRLPKLMITNCLDTKHNSWDDDRPTGGLSGSDNNGDNTVVGTDNFGVVISQATSAQNCHRLGSGEATGGPGIGWNKLTPWSPP